MTGLLMLGGVLLLIIICSVIGARRGTEQTTVFGDPETERQRARTIGTGSKGN
jgi:hypothetical protein